MIYSANVAIVASWDDAAEVHIVGNYPVNVDSDSFKSHGPITDGYSGGTTSRCGTYVYGVSRMYEASHALGMVTCEACKS